jgi:hypothetical protein
MQTRAQVICAKRQSSNFAIHAKRIGMNDDPKKNSQMRNAEVDRLIAESGRTQKEVASYLSTKLKHNYEHYVVSRMAAGERKVASFEMDALRELASQREDVVLTIPPVNGDSEFVQLFGYIGGGVGGLRLKEENCVGVVPIHPLQKGFKSSFAFTCVGDYLSPRLNHGEIGYAIKNRSPMKGQLCVIEFANGDAQVKFYDGQDDRTVFVSHINPKTQLKYALRDVVGLHLVVGAAFS